jgi:hypothetical protein
LLSQFSLKTKYIDLYHSNPEEFLNEYVKTVNYIGRYRSYLNNSTRSEERHEKDKVNLDKYKEIEEILREIQEESGK